MGTPAASQVLRMPARLVASPTSMAGTFPFGGTALGETRDIKVRWGFEVGMIVDEGASDPHFAGVATGFALVASCRLRAVDPDALLKVFLNTKLGTWNDRKVYESAKSANVGYKRPGAAVEKGNFALLIAPLDESRHPFFILYNAMPILAPDAEIDYSRAREVGIQVGFHAACDNDSTLRRFDWGRKGSLTL